MQNYTFLGRSGFGMTHASAGTFWETSAEYMAMQVYPSGGAGDLTRFLRTENLYYSSSRHHYGNWMLVQHLVDRNGGIGIFNRIWNEVRNTEHPLEAYRRIANLSQAQLNAQLGEYAQRQVTYDYSNRSSFMPFVNSVYGGGFINAYNGVPVEAVNQSTGHYRIPDPLAPSDYGYNKIKLVPSVGRCAHPDALQGPRERGGPVRWTYGFVAVRNGVPRYGPVITAPDAEISFQTQPGERDVYLVVLGAPGAVHKYAFLDGYPRNYRYPYEFRIAGATPSGFEPGYTKPTPVGGRWHSNGGGWVDNRANVAATAYVGPRAAVFGNSTVRDNARIEGLAWVNSGATVGGNAVVRDNAIVQGGANLGGSIVLGGDAEMGIACSAGTYRMFTTSRGCDGGAGEADINPPHGTFTDAELAITGTTTPPTTTPTPTTIHQQPRAPTTRRRRPPRRGRRPPPPRPAHRPRPPRAAPAGRTCTATYRIVGSWSGGFQGEVSVQAGTSAITGWTVTWAFANGQAVTQAWGAALTSSGANITARNETWNGALGANAAPRSASWPTWAPPTPYRRRPARRPDRRPSSRGRRQPGRPRGDGAAAILSAVSARPSAGRASPARSRHACRASTRRPHASTVGRPRRRPALTIALAGSSSPPACCCPPRPPTPPRPAGSTTPRPGTTAPGSGPTSPLPTSVTRSRPGHSAGPGPATNGSPTAGRASGPSPAPR